MLIKVNGGVWFFQLWKLILKSTGAVKWLRAACHSYRAGFLIPPDLSGASHEVQDTLPPYDALFFPHTTIVVRNIGTYGCMAQWEFTPLQTWSGVKKHCLCRTHVQAAVPWLAQWQIVFFSGLQVVLTDQESGQTQQGVRATLKSTTSHTLTILENKRYFLTSYTVGEDWLRTWVNRKWREVIGQKLAYPICYPAIFSTSLDAEHCHGGSVFCALECRMRRVLWHLFTAAIIEMISSLTLRL